jgi:ATP-binding cassette subfamily A (ABC1) protein 1
VEDVCPKLTATGVSLTDFLHPFDWDVSMGNITFLLVEAVVYFLLTLAIEYARTQPWLMRICSEGSGCVLGWRPWRRRRGSKDGEEGSEGPQGPQAEEEGAQEDDDVRAEAERVLSGRGRGDVVRIERLRKVFQTGAGPKVAVKDLTFGIRPGTLHGFLGVNGAGEGGRLEGLSRRHFFEYSYVCVP